MTLHTVVALQSLAETSRLFAYPVVEIEKLIELLLKHRALLAFLAVGVGVGFTEILEIGFHRSDKLRDLQPALLIERFRVLLQSLCC